MQDHDRFVLLSLYKILVSLVDSIYHCFFLVTYSRSLPSMIPNPNFSVIAAINAPSEAAQDSQRTSLHSFIASLTVSASAFGAEIILFILLKDRLTQL